MATIVVLNSQNLDKVHYIEENSRTFLKNRANDPVFFGFIGWLVAVDVGVTGGATLLDCTVVLATPLTGTGEDTIWIGIST